MLQIGLRSNSSLLYSHNVLRISLISLGNVFQSPYQYQKLILMSETAFSLIPNYQKSTIRKSESYSCSCSCSSSYYYFETVPKGKT